MAAETLPENTQNETPQSTVVVLDLPFYLMISMIFLSVIGVFTFMFSFTYIQDLATLSEVPDILWDFTCGRPVEGGIGLPLLMTLSIVAFLSSGVMYGWRRWLLGKASTSEVGESEI